MGIKRKNADEQKTKQQQQQKKPPSKINRQRKTHK